MCNTLHFSGLDVELRLEVWQVNTVSDSLQKHYLNLANVFKTFALLILVCAFFIISASAESCRSGSDLDEATRNALNTAAMRDFALISGGDTAGLRQNAIFSLASDFSGVEAVIKQNQPALAGAKATARPPFLLEADGTAPIEHAEFYCGVFGAAGQTANSAAFYLSNLAPGKYGVVILDAPTSKGAYAVSLILQQQGTDWKLGGLYIKAAQFAGHDSAWFISKAHDYESKGQNHNAWLYFYEARILASPIPFMSTLNTDKLYDEAQKLQPSDFPAQGKTANLLAGTATYTLTAIFPDAVNGDLDLIVKYHAASIADTNQSYASNIAVMKALLAKYPELRDAFGSVVARAVDPTGHDYGTLLAMKDIK